MDLSIIIVSWNVRDKLRENLKAIAGSQGDLAYEIFVVDNNSRDGSADLVRQEFPQVKLIANRENLGFAKANNQAIRLARGDFILLLNPDMRVFPDTLINMVSWMKSNPQASLAGCRLVDERGNVIKQARRFPTVWDQLAIVLKLPHLWPGILNKYLRSDFDYDRPAQVDSIRGGFFIIRQRPDFSFAKASARVALILPYLDERYFLWFEEVDYCRQVDQAGGQAWYTPAAQCLDYVGQSFKQLPRDRAQRYFRASMLKYFAKWQPAWQYWLLWAAWPLSLALTFVLSKFKIKSKVRT